MAKKDSTTTPSQSNTNPENHKETRLIDGVFVIAKGVDTLALYDKLLERLAQLDAATEPPDELTAQMSGKRLHNYLWLLQSMIRQVQGLACELNQRLN